MSKKVLLINPKLPERLVRLNIHLGLLYVGTQLFHQGYEVNILEANNAAHNKQFFDKLKRELDGTLAVGLSVMTAQISSAMEISRYVRDFYPSIPIIWGGVHPTLYPEQVAGSECVDFAVRGDGEITAIELLAAIGNNSDPRKVKGISFQSGQEVITTGDREPMDINQSPHPEWNLMEDIRAVGDMAEVARSSGVGLPIMTSRGCPHRCAFCINSILRLKYRYRQTDLVIKDIEDILSLGVSRISFFDEDMFANKRMLIEIIDEIEKRGLDFRWFGTARADYFRERHINLELLTRIKRSGCQQLGLGVESGSQRVLDILKKDITVEDTIHAARMLNQVGIDATFSFMIGLPGEGGDDIKQTLRLITKITAINNTFRILGPFIYRPYPGSELYFECLKLGMKEPASLEEWATSPYIGSEISPRDYHMFPWVQYPMKDLTRLIFYSWMSGLRLRYSLLTRIARAVGAWRSNRHYFKWPVELLALRLMRKVGLDRLLSVGKFD